MTPFGLAALLPVLELDAAMAGQLMLSRPLVAGSLFGLALSRPVEGLMAGAVLEGMSAEEPPVGGRVPLNATVAVGVAMLMPLPLPAAFPVGLLAGWLHARGEQVVRQKRAVLGGMAERGAGWWRIIGLSLAMQICWTAVITASAVFLLGQPLASAWRQAPAPLRSGLEFAWSVAPWLAAATLFKAYRRAA
jgi:mannose/fructose/N-acetylgalactosamine-specific phosphotransferase system component IIC